MNKMKANENNPLKITDIKHSKSKERRADGRYPQRIGSTIFLLDEPQVGECAFLAYIKDNEGNDKAGILRTSPVAEVCETPNAIRIVLQRNTHLILSQFQQKEQQLFYARKIIYFMT